MLDGTGVCIENISLLYFSGVGVTSPRICKTACPLAHDMITKLAVNFSLLGLGWGRSCRGRGGDRQGDVCNGFNYVWSKLSQVYRLQGELCE